MKIALFGATGFTGRAVLAEALSRRFHVTALIRDPSRLSTPHPNLRFIRGDALDAGLLESVILDQDAVIQCLGIGGYGNGAPSTFVSDATRLIVQTMQKQGARRLICMSNTGVGGSHNPWIMRKVILPFFLRALIPIMDDKERMEPMVMGSGLQWTIVRFPNIVDRPARGRIKVSRDGRGISFSIAVQDAARFLVDQLTDATHLQQAVSISN